MNGPEKLGMTPEMAVIMESLPSSFMAKAKTSRYFDVTVSDRSGEVIEFYEAVPTAIAGRIRNENRRIGNRVNQIEVSNLSGEVIRHDFIPPEVHHSQVSDKPIVTPSKYNARSAKVNAKYQQKFFGAANAELKRHSDKENSHILVYEKISGNLVFSGDLGGATAFIISKMEAGVWNETSWVIYLPKKLYDILGTTNG